MKNTIDRKTFDHLVDLAALELGEEQAEYLRGELNHQLDSIHELEAIPLEDDLEPASHGVPYPAQVSQKLRNDEWNPYPNPEEIIDQSPESEGGFINVPDIPTEKLD